MFSYFIFEIIWQPFILWFSGPSESLPLGTLKGSDEEIERQVGVEASPVLWSPPWRDRGKFEGSLDYVERLCLKKK